MAPIHVVEERLNVEVDDPVTAHLHQPLPHSSVNFETPLLMIVGDGDWFSWLPEMIMQFNALREAGKEAELVRYASEGHTFVSAEARQDVWRRLKVHYGRHLVQK